LGVDVSHYQGAIDWSAVARTPYRFGLARLTIGQVTTDDRGRGNLAHMLDTMPVAGAYGVVGMADPVEAGAKRLVDEIAKAGADPAKILVMLDAENFGDGSHPTIGQVDAYATELHSLIGRWPVAYVPGWWLGEHGYTVSGRNLANCPWAQSHYLPAPWTETKLQANKPALAYGFKSLAWLQFTDVASISGIAGGVDGNVFYGDLATLRQRLLGGQPEEDLSIVDAETKTYIDGKFEGLAGRLDRAVLFLAAGVSNTAYSSSTTNPRPLPDMAKATNLQELADALKAGQPITLTQEQLDQVKAALQTLEGSALVQLAVSPA